MILNCSLRARFWFSLFAGVALLLPTGCSGNGGGAGGRQFLSIGTAPVGGAFFPVGGAIAATLNDNKGDNTWKVTGEATKGSQENIRRLDKGQLDLALSNSAITYFAVRGEEGWDKQYPMRTVMTLAPNIAFFISPDATGIKTIPDMKGKRVILGPAGAGFEYFLKPMLAQEGVSYDDLQVLHATQSDAVGQLADDAAQAAFLGGAVPTASITQACTTQDINFIPFGPAAIEKLVLEYPFFKEAVVPAGTYPKHDEAYQGLNVGSMHLITTAAMPDELIYDITKTIYENREEVTAKHPAGKSINPNNIATYTGTPFHPGAIAYYKEIGIWKGESSELTEVDDTNIAKPADVAPENE
ncbi:NMT1/THI5 like protein [Planctomycetes bacterium Pan216]|uniref:NMT1/THI5 like protein n=1 Tax=Kolteria novifilia TaxID=2527975 RepID=A0A518AZF0_9BACT|nr:NMT1/THI5 like protein [Planctomycetes bacterium Pan216]